MGNVCCQTEVNASVLQNQVLQIHQYQQAQLPQDHQDINDWLTRNNLTFPQNGDHPNLQVTTMKQINGHRYYVGTWRKGVPEGKGFIYEPNKILFLGNFHNGVPEGQSSISFIQEGIQFNGDLKEGKANGNGTIKNLQQRFTFAGEWEDSKPRRGKITLSDQNISAIQIKDYTTGDAIIFYTDNRKYEGSINTRKLLPHGKGKVTFVYHYKKDYYQGDWHNGFMHGSGKYVWKDESVYEGDFIQGRKEGQGKFTFPNANYYEGFWMKGKQNGTGVFVSKSNEQVKKGIWQNGAFLKVLDDQSFKRESKIYEERASTNKREVEEVLRREEEEERNESGHNKQSVSSEKLQKNNTHEDERLKEDRGGALEKREEHNY